MEKTKALVSMIRLFKKVFKHALYFSFYYSGILRIIVKLHKIKNRHHRVIILFYHRFANKKDKEKVLPYTDIVAFEKQIVYLKNLYNFVSMDEIAQTLKNEGAFSQPSIALTIDDGYVDNYLLAYPVLNKYHIPAVIYLTLGLIGTRASLWVDDIEYALTQAGVPTFRLEELENELIDISVLEGRRRAEKMLYSAMVKLDNCERQKIIGKLFEVLHVNVSDIETKPRRMLNWEEIIEMSKGGIAFGAHTMSHPCLSGIATEVAKDEIGMSKEILERYVEAPVKHFAVPNGKEEDFTSELREYCRKIGFDSIVTTEPGIVDSKGDRFRLKRVLPTPPLYYFACEIARYLFFRKTA
jgi:peptidoglycan/xylan/chitin deacetylase (PgdA/CDA1 family)